MCRRSPRVPPFRATALVALAIAVTATARGAAVSAAADADSSMRVRSSHAYIRAMIAEASERSDTFRRLVQAIERTDGIVYVEQGACGHSVHACLSLQVTAAANFRILRVTIDARQPDWEVMASIGHELQHAVEVLSNAKLTSAEAVFLFYSNGSNNDSFETQAAIKAGDDVRRQVGAYAKRKLS